MVSFHLTGFLWKVSTNSALTLLCHRNSWWCARQRTISTPSTISMVPYTHHRIVRWYLIRRALTPRRLNRWPASRSIELVSGSFYRLIPTVQISPLDPGHSFLSNPRSCRVTRARRYSPHCRPLTPRPPSCSPSRSPSAANHRHPPVRHLAATFTPRASCLHHNHRATTLPA